MQSHTEDLVLVQDTGQAFQGFTNVVHSIKHVSHKPIGKSVMEGYTSVEEKDEKDENACNGACDKDLSSERAIILPCGHKFCVACMKDRVDDNFITCCFCDSVRIPEYIRDELRNVDVVRE